MINIFRGLYLNNKKLISNIVFVVEIFFLLGLLGLIAIGNTKDNNIEMKSQKIDSIYVVIKSQIHNVKSELRSISNNIELLDSLRKDDHNGK